MTIKDAALTFIEGYFDRYRGMKCAACRHLDGKGSSQVCRILEQKAEMKACPALPDSFRGITHYGAGPKLYP